MSFGGFAVGVPSLRFLRFTLETTQYLLGESMERIFRLTRAAALTSSTVLLVACGGGGGGTSTTTSLPSSAPSSATPTAAITTSNAVQIASTAFNGTSGLSQLGSSATALKATTGQPVNILSIVSGTLTNELQSRLYVSPLSPQMRVAKSTSNSQQCAGGGSITTLINEAGATWQPGDSISITANACQESANGPAINGNLALTLGSIAQNGPSGFIGSISFVANNFSATQGSHYASLNGSFQANVTIQDTDYVASAAQVELTTSGFTLSSDTVGTISIENLEYIDFDNIAQESWGFTLNATVNNNGSIFTVQTNQQFAGSGCSYPLSGSALLTGLGSSAVVTANPNGTTTLQITNGGTTTSQTVPSNQVFSQVCS